jgi:hypothetical protein
LSGYSRCDCRRYLELWAATARRDVKAVSASVHVHDQYYFWLFSIRNCIYHGSFDYLGIEKYGTARTYCAWASHRWIQNVRVILGHFDILCWSIEATRKKCDAHMHTRTDPHDYTLGHLLKQKWISCARLYPKQMVVERSWSELKELSGS